MLDSLPSAYADPMFVSLVLWGTAVSMAAFLVFAIPLTWLAHRPPPWADRYRIQERKADVGAWWGRSVRQWLLNNLIMLALMVLAWPLVAALSRVHAGPPPPLWVAGMQLVGFVYLDDLLYHLMHRGMHKGWLYDNIHRMHHRVATPSAITGHYMHPVEYVLTGTLMLAGPVLLGAHIQVVYAWIVFRQLEAAEGHSGYHIPLSPLSWLPGGHGADFHDFHHSRFHGNYAGILAWTDRVAGTWSRGYAEHVAARGLPPPR